MVEWTNNTHTFTQPPVQSKAAIWTVKEQRRNWLYEIQFLDLVSNNEVIYLSELTNYKLTEIQRNNFINTIYLTAFRAWKTIPIYYLVELFKFIRLKTIMCILQKLLIKNITFFSLADITHDTLFFYTSYHNTRT